MFEWCTEQDLNLHESPHMNLNHTRLPIPPSVHTIILTQNS